MEKERKITFTTKRKGKRNYGIWISSAHYTQIADSVTPPGRESIQVQFPLLVIYLHVPLCRCRLHNQWRTLVYHWTFHKGAQPSEWLDELAYVKLNIRNLTWGWVARKILLWFAEGRRSGRKRTLWPVEAGSFFYFIFIFKKRHWVTQPEIKRKTE